MSKTYKTAEACRVLDVQPYVLRYWETEFSALGGKKPGAQRVYSEKEIVILQRIKKLLYDEGYTIAGAKKRLVAEADDGESVDGPTKAPSKSRSTVKKTTAKTPAKRGSKSAKKAEPAPQNAKQPPVNQKELPAGATDAAESLDREDLRSIESVRIELLKLHAEAIEILALVRAGKGG